MKFQFMIAVIPIKEGPVEDLEAIGADGWEAVSVLPSQAQSLNPQTGMMVPVPALAIFMQRAYDYAEQTTDPDAPVTLFPQGIRMEPEQGTIGDNGAA